jgi:hypothetical protein
MVEALGDETLSDEDLLARIADEDRSAFTILMRRHGKKVRGLALAFLAAGLQTPTMLPRTSSSCCGAARIHGSPERPRSRRGLYRVVANRCLDQARRQRVRRWLPFEDAADPVNETPSALDVLSNRDRLAEVRRMILTLPEKQRLALLLGPRRAKQCRDRIDPRRQRGCCGTIAGACAAKIALARGGAGGGGVTREDFSEALLHFGADLDRWPRPEADTARQLVNDDPVAPRMLADFAAANAPSPTPSSRRRLVLQRSERYSAHFQRLGAFRGSRRVFGSQVQPASRCCPSSPVSW